MRIDGKEEFIGVGINNNDDNNNNIHFTIIFTSFFFRRGGEKEGGRIAEGLQLRVGIADYLGEGFMRHLGGYDHQIVHSLHLLSPIIITIIIITLLIK